MADWPKVDGLEWLYCYGDISLSTYLKLKYGERDSMGDNNSAHEENDNDERNDND